MRTEFDEIKLTYHKNDKTNDSLKLNNRTILYLSLRRYFEVLFLFLVLPFVLIFLILCSVILFVDMKGNILFTQIRVGKNGLPFKIYKFRTFKGIRNNDIQSISKIGKFFRKHHLDELPQFFNVLNGDMSLIGPRPEIFMEYLTFSSIIEGYRLRKLVPQGITGLAQIFVPNSQCIYQNIAKLKYDIEYIKNISLKTDITILLKTIIVIFRGRELINTDISGKSYRE